MVMVNYMSLRLGAEGVLSCHAGVRWRREDFHCKTYILSLNPLEPRDVLCNVTRAASTASLVTLTACKFSGYASDTEHKLVTISNALGKYQNRTLGLGLIYPSCRYNYNLSHHVACTHDKGDMLNFFCFSFFVTSA